jgi:hypothetical protein
MLAGTQVAHAFAYRLVYPEAQVRMRDLFSTGHSYMYFGLSGYVGYLPLLLGLVGAIELVAFGWLVCARVRRRQHAPVPPWAFALLPLIMFSVQEFFERWLAGMTFPWWMVLQPTFQIGLLLQLPFALAAFLLARLLLRVAKHVARVLAGEPPRPLVPGLPPRRASLPVCEPRLDALARGYAGRGPPLRLLRRPSLPATS